MGDPLALAVLSTAPSGVVVSVPFGQRLYSGDSGSFDLAFDVLDPGGSTDRDLRFGHNLMSFPVSAFGSPGDTDLTNIAGTQTFDAVVLEFDAHVDCV